MKGEIFIDTEEMVKQITLEVIRSIKPTLEKMKIQEDVLFTVKTLAKYLEVSNQWVYERVSLREIPFIKMGKFPRFKKSDIDQWLDKQKTPAINPLSRPIKPIKRIIQM